MRIIVTGGRDCADREAVFTALDKLNAESQIVRVIQGGASGADRLAAQWAIQNNIACETCPADWRTHGRAAGPIRNANMLTNHPGATVVAFPGGRGTADMVRRAEIAGARIVRVSEISDKTKAPVK